MLKITKKQSGNTVLFDGVNGAVNIETLGGEYENTIYFG